MNSQTPCHQCGRDGAVRDWEGRALCQGCWVDLTVCRYLRDWSTHPEIQLKYSHKGVPLAVTFEYDLLGAILDDLKHGFGPPEEGGR